MKRIRILSIILLILFYNCNEQIEDIELVANPATNISGTKFTANWEKIDNISNVYLNLSNKENLSILEVSVTEDGNYEVGNLDGNTEYSYYLFKNDIYSNVISVTTTNPLDSIYFEKFIVINYEYDDINNIYNAETDSVIYSSLKEKTYYFRYYFQNYHKTDKTISCSISSSNQYIAELSTSNNISEFRDEDNNQYSFLPYNKSCFSYSQEFSEEVFPLNLSAYSFSVTFRPYMHVGAKIPFVISINSSNTSKVFSFYVSVK